MTRRFASIFVALTTAVVPNALRAEPNAEQWLQRMAMASQSLNYTGTFVYQREGSLEAMQILHAKDEAGERERLFSLTGPKREVLRDNRVVTCILGDSQSVVVSKSRPRTPFPMSLPSELRELKQHYSFEVQGEDRVAGLICRLVEVKPHDNYRYGRRLCVHEDSHLLLRSELTGVNSETIEQIMFTSVEFPERIAAKELLPNLNGADYTWHREPEEQPEPGQVIQDSRWKVIQVPDGFMLTDYSWHRLSETDPGVEHWVYSDGLASVSVYIEKSQKDHDAYSGVSHRGALNAYGKMADGHYITVVGEVPRQTVELIANSVRIK